MKKDNLHKMIKTYNRVRDYLDENGIEYSEPTTSAFTISIGDKDVESILDGINEILKDECRKNITKHNVLDNKLFIQFKGKF